MRILQTVGCIALVASLSGCFLLPLADESDAKPEPTASTPVADRPPEVGDCWTGEYTSFVNWTAWKGDDAIDCGEDHQSYTYAISTVFDGRDDSYPLNGMDAEASNLAYESCNSLLAKFLTRHLDGWPRLETYYFGPSAQQWNQGERWLRCDLVVLALGSSIFEPEIADLPERGSDIAAALEEHEDYFDFCVNTDEAWTGFGPFESESAVYANCSDDPMWRLHGYDFYPADYDAPFPGDDVLQAFTSEGCLADMPSSQPGYSYYPDPESWKAGDRSVTCWEYEWEVPEGTAPPV